MDIVKKNLISIICGVVAILALVAVFVWPLDGYYEELKTRAQERAAVFGKAQGLDRKQRFWPIVDLEQTTPKPLDQFPSQDVIKAGEKARKDAEKQSAGVYQEAVKINGEKHTPVVEGALPEPRSTTIALKFRQSYTDKLTELRTTVLKAGVPPTEEEVKRRAGELWKEMEKAYIWVPGNAEPVNKAQIDQKFKAAEAQLPYQIQNEMATQWKMYVDPTKVFRVPQALPTNQMPDPQHIWWCNVEYWVYSDVCNAIAEVNEKSNNVLGSPVKNLLLLDVPWAFFPGQGQGNPGGVTIGGGDPAADPSALPATGGRPDPTIAIPEGNPVSPTKRLSNNLYDVVHFTMAVDIEASAVPSP